MSKFNPLDYPISLADPLWLAPTGWAGHIPFAMTLISVLKPRVFVELGTYTGVSYCAFCQAIKELDLKARCYAIDTWQGDEHSGVYDEEVLETLKRHHDPLYGEFSSFIQSDFDQALPRFDNNSIDVLHIDGYHTYDSVKHDFESWLPKMSDRGVILFHDTNVREGDFGVWQLWLELKDLYPHFEFTHEHGLGVLAIGAAQPDEFKALVQASEDDAWLVREYFSQLGRRLAMRVEYDLEREEKARETARLSLELQTQLTQKKTLNSQKETLNSQLLAEQSSRKEISAVLAERQAYLERIHASRAWRWVGRYGRFKNRLFRFLGTARNGAKSESERQAD